MRACVRMCVCVCVWILIVKRKDGVSGRADYVVGFFGLGPGTKGHSLCKKSLERWNTVITVNVTVQPRQLGLVGGSYNS